MQNVNGVLFTRVQGVYVTYIYKGGPAHQSGLHVHDKILQVWCFLICVFNVQNIIVEMATIMCISSYQLID